MDFPGGSSGKEYTCQWRRHKMQIQSLGQEDALEKVTSFSILAWIPLMFIYDENLLLLSKSNFI